MKITRQQLKTIIKKELQNLMEDDERTMQQMMRRDFDQPEHAAADRQREREHRRETYSEPTMSVDRTPRGGDLIDTGLGVVSTAAGAVPHPVAQGIAAGASGIQHGRRYMRGEETAGEAARGFATDVLPTGRAARTLGAGADVVRAADDVAGAARTTAGTAGLTSKRDDLYAEHIQRIIEEELQDILNEQGVSHEI